MDHDFAAAAHLIDPRRLWAGEAPFTGPVAVVDCAAAREWPEQIALPPCPVIALGDRAHPLAQALDTVVEAPVALPGLLAQVLARPRAAGIVTELLRLLPALPAEAGLVAESLAYGALQASGEHGEWLAARAAPRAPQPPGTVRLARQEGRLEVVMAGEVVDRPMRDALAEAFALAALEPGLAVRLRGEGRCFSLGAALGEFGTTRDAATAHHIRRLTLPARHLAAIAGRLEAHVHGACVGAGLEMAAWAARITATPDAWFQLPELAMGVLPGAGGCVSLVRRIGRQRTALMVLSGRRVPARIAREWGLVDHLAGENGGAHVG